MSQTRRLARFDRRGDSLELTKIRHISWDDQSISASFGKFPMTGLNSLPTENNSLRRGNNSLRAAPGLRVCRVFMRLLAGQRAKISQISLLPGNLPRRR
jgi:hypothetical protein